jgi:hypothetical protein
MTIKEGTKFKGKKCKKVQVRKILNVSKVSTTRTVTIGGMNNLNGESKSLLIINIKKKGTTYEN